MFVGIYYTYITYTSDKYLSITYVLGTANGKYSNR